MACHKRGCLGDYNFEHIVHHAIKRFIEGYSTISLMEQAKSELEKEEIALVCMLDVEDNIVLDMHLTCRHADKCKVTNCRAELKRLIEKELEFK